MTQVHSQNGWPAYPDTSRFVHVIVCGRGWWFANADVATVFTEFIKRFNREVEPIIAGGEVLNDWSFANRLVRGSTQTVSNHGSATAIDVNSDHHPLGVKGTFSPAKAKAMRRIRADITDDSGDPVLRLGLDYTGRHDEMHVEINAGPRAVHQAAEKIRAKKSEEAVEFTDEQLKKLGAAMLDAEIELTPAAAAAIGGDAKPGQKVTLRYALQWSPLVRRTAREDAERDARLQSAVDALAAQVGRLGQISSGGVDLDALATAVANKLADRMKS